MPEKGIANPIDKANVLSVYSGKPGCCCGCQGKYSYREDLEMRAVARKYRGYEITDDEVSERNVTRIVNILNRNLKDIEVVDGNIFCFNTDVRWYMVHMIDR